MKRWASGREAAVLLLAVAVLLASASCGASGISSTAGASGTKKTEIWQIDLLPGNGGGNGAGFGPVAPPHPPPPPPPPPPSPTFGHHHHHHLHSLPANHRGGNGGGVHDVGLHVFSPGGGDSFEQPMPIHTIMHTPLQMIGTPEQGPRWPSSSSDCAMSSKDMSALAPFVALVVGLAVALPMLIILFIAKMYLWTQLTGGTVTPTVTTSVGGRKEEAIARRLADALPAFQNAINKYVFDGRSVGVPKNMTTKSM